MNKNAFRQFIKHQEKVNAIVDKETKQLSFKDKFQQMVSLVQFFWEARKIPRKEKHTFTNWALLKSRV